MKNFIRTLFVIFLFIPALQALFAQNKFANEQLLYPLRFGEKISSQLQPTEVFEFNTTPVKNCFLLKNGLRSSSYVNAGEWLAIKDTVIPYRIDVIYSKYPLRKGVYKEIYPLLCNRLINLFKIDPDLNEQGMEWNKVLQTHCINDAQVDSLFHGIAIWYRTANSEETEDTDPEYNLEFTFDEEAGAQGAQNDLVKNLEQMKESSFLSDSLKKAIKNLPLDKQMSTIRNYLFTKIQGAKDKELSKATELEIRSFELKVKEFVDTYKAADETVSKVFDRHPEWKKILVINDWTGSMYGYGAQVLQWHLLNFEKSGIVSLTLFNDGDQKSTHEKKVGETGGIYSEKADNIEKLVDLFNYIMLKGGGGDGPENDVEAILKAMDNGEEYDAVVLIADNNACVRDIELADRIDKPVKVILCGYHEQTGINPDFVYLAKTTGGGIYTIEKDIENIQVKLGIKGEVVENNDERIKIKGKRCGESSFSKGGITYVDLKKALKRKNQVRRLSLVEKGMTEIHKGIYKMELLNYLNLSNNHIQFVSPQIKNLTYLKTLILSSNEITDLPTELKEVKYIQTIDLSKNKLSKLSTNIMNLKYLKTLDLSYNQIREIDQSSSMKKLEYLNLSNNQLKEIPVSFGKLKKLKTLILSNNQITQLPDQITNLYNLEELNLENNQLKSLPPNLENLKKLKVLKLGGNEIPEGEKENIRKALPLTTIYFD